MNQYPLKECLEARQSLHLRASPEVPNVLDVVNAVLKPRINQSSRIADLGAGSGVFWRQFADCIPENLILVDASDAFHEELAQALPLASVVHCDFERTEIQASSLDGAFAHSVFHYASTPFSLYSELSRILKPGGWLSILQPCLGNLQSLSDIAESCDPQGLLGKRAIKTTTFERLASDIDERFCTESTIRIKNSMKLDNREAVARYLTSFFLDLPSDLLDSVKFKIGEKLDYIFDQQGALNTEREYGHLILTKK